MRSAAIATLLLLVPSVPVTAGEPADERHLYLYDGSGMPSWLPESLVEIDPERIEHMEMYEVTRYPRRRQPDPEQQAAADELVRRVRAAADAHGWHDFETARAAGWQPMAGDDAHYVNRALLRDGRVLDPERPEFLMFYDSGPGEDATKVLVGAMFLVEAPDAEGPQIGGPLTRWHFHIWREPRCLLDGLVVLGAADAEGRCAEGVAGRRSPEMLHVWLIDHPEGPFATKMHLEPWQLERLGGHHHHH